jgi:hypothetical protein
MVRLKVTLETPALYVAAVLTLAYTVPVAPFQWASTRLLDVFSIRYTLRLISVVVVSLP